MRVLMLDKNYFTDRRIVLVSEELIKLGHSVKILAHTPPATAAAQSPTGIPTEWLDEAGRLSASHRHEGGIFPRPAHVEKVLKKIQKTGSGAQEEAVPTLTVSRKAERVEAYLRQRIPIRQLATLILFIRFPSLAVDRLMPSANTLSRSLRVLPFYLLRENFKLIYKIPIGIFDVFFRGAEGPTGLSPGIEDIVVGTWESGAERVAMDWKPDVIVANDLPTLPVGVAVKKALGIPLVYDAHELYSYQPHITPANAEKLFLQELTLIAYVDETMVINKEQATIMERDLGAKNFTVLTNATSTPPAFSVEKTYNHLRQATGIGADQKIMLFQGGINTYRRIDFLLHGLSLCKSTNVHIAFLTFGAEQREFLKMAESLGIRDRVHMLPLVPWSEVVYWCASADCGIMPYQATDQNTIISNPNKLYEFLMAGTPVIGSSELTNLHKIVTENNFGVTVPLRKIDDYAQAIDLMFDESLGGPERFRESLLANRMKFSWSAESKAMIEMYKRLAAERPSSAPPTASANSEDAE